MGKKKMFLKNGVLPTAGQIYKDAAWNCFRERYPEMAIVDVEEILNRGLFHEIESFVHVGGLLEAGAKSLTQDFARDRIRVSSDFLWTLLFSETPKDDMRSLISAARLRNYDDHEKAVMTIKALGAIHDEWVRLHDEDFFKPEKAQLRCKFMPFELIGPEAALKYRIVFDEVLALFGWKVSDEELRKLYWRLQKNFNVQNDLYTVEDLKKYLMKGGYVSLSDRIVKTLKENEDLADEMACS